MSGIFIRNRCDLRRARRGWRGRGFTLLELMITLSMIAIVLAFAIPTFLPQMVSHQSREGALAIFSWLKVCRSQAVTSARAVSCDIAFSAEDDTVSTSLEMDVDGNGVPEQLYSNTIGIGAFSKRNTETFEVDFTPLGLAEKMAPAEGVLRLCGVAEEVQNDISSSTYVITVAGSGIVRIEELTNAACDDLG